MAIWKTILQIKKHQGHKTVKGSSLSIYCMDYRENCHINGIHLSQNKVYCEGWYKERESTWLYEMWKAKK